MKEEKQTQTEQPGNTGYYDFDNHGNRKEPPVIPQAVSMQDTAGKKSGKGRFFLGLAVGLALATAVCVIGFAVVYPRMEQARAQAEAQQNAGSGSSVSSELLLDRETREKINRIDRTITENYYLDDTQTEDKRNALYKGLVNSLGDIYSVYYTEEEYEELLQSNEGIYYGIGAYVSLDEEMMRAYISGVIPGSPAEEAKLREGDYIWEVDGVSTEGMQTDEVASMIRGPEGTDVEVLIVRDGEEMPFTLTRRRVEHQTVSARMLEDSEIGYLQISEFDSVSPAQFVEKYAELQAQGMKALVLDLRSNPGGSLAAVCDIANELLPEGDIVYTIDKYGNQENYVADGKHEIQMPLAVLINGNSASASEILAGAIKDYGKGTLIGTTTFGKGIVQRYFPFDDGTAVKLTISDYYTPSGKNIHGVGIAPDVEVEFDADAYEKDGTDNQLERAKKILEKEIS